MTYLVKNTVGVPMGRNVEEWRLFSWCAGDGVADLADLWCRLDEEPDERYDEAHTICTLGENTGSSRRALCEWLRYQMAASMQFIEREGGSGLSAWSHKARFRELEKEDMIGIDWVGGAMLNAWSTIESVRVFVELTDGAGQNVHVKDYL